MLLKNNVVKNRKLNSNFYRQKYIVKNFKIAFCLIKTQLTIHKFRGYNTKHE